MRVSLLSLQSRLSAAHDCASGGCYSLDQPGPDSAGRRRSVWLKRALINDKEEVERGESGLNLSQGKRHAGFLSKSSLDHFLGEKRHPAFCRL